MVVKTKFFGELELPEEKIISLERGLIGLDEYKKFTILYDSEKEKSNIAWFQSVDEPTFALPVISPELVKDDYNPNIREELLEGIGELDEENLVVFLVLTVPEDIKEMTVNLMAPIIINADTRKGVQAIVDNEGYEVRYKIYDVLNTEKSKQ